MPKALAFFGPSAIVMAFAIKIFGGVGHDLANVFTQAASLTGH